MTVGYTKLEDNIDEVVSVITEIAAIVRDSMLHAGFVGVI